MKKSLQRGFSLVSAIFLLVVISALGAFAVTLSTAQNQSQTLEVMGARAYQAALAGIEWATFYVRAESANAPAPWAGCAAGASFVPNTPSALGGTLAPFRVTVTCGPAISAVEGVNTVWIYDVSAVASTGGAPGDANYVEQVATAKLAR